MNFYFYFYVGGRWNSEALLNKIVKLGTRDTSKITRMVLAGMMIMASLETGNLVRMGKFGSYFSAHRFHILVGVL